MLLQFTVVRVIMGWLVQFVPFQPKPNSHRQTVGSKALTLAPGMALQSGRHAFLFESQ
jgi:hypothetical protein